MIWAGLTDHLLCKTELFLDARFSFLSFWYLQIILYIIISLEKVENKSFKSFQPGLNLTIWPEPWPELKNMFLIWPRGQTDELIGLQLHQVHLVHKLDGLESKLDSWKQELRTVQFRLRTIIRFNKKIFFATGHLHRRLSSSFKILARPVFVSATFQFSPSSFRSFNLIDRSISVFWTVYFQLVLAVCFKIILTVLFNSLKSCNRPLWHMTFHFLFGSEPSNFLTRESLIETVHFFCDSGASTFPCTSDFLLKIDLTLWKTTIQTYSVCSQTASMLNQYSIMLLNRDYSNLADGPECRPLIGSYGWDIRVRTCD